MLPARDDLDVCRRCYVSVFPTPIFVAGHKYPSKMFSPRKITIGSMQ
jgi:hypothetical protein